MRPVVDRMRPLQAGITALLVIATWQAAGCAELFDDKPDVTFLVTPLSEDGWNRDGYVKAQVVEPGHTVLIDARSGTTRVRESGEGVVEVTIPDGTWDIVFRVDDSTWRKLEDVRIDATPPELRNLEIQGIARAGAYSL